MHPEVWSCKDCETYSHTDWKLTTRIGPDGKTRLPLLRKDTGGTVTPCCKCPKIPEIPGTVKVRENAIEMSEKNRLAFLHWKECKAVGKFPDDAVVRQNAAIIEGVVNQVERAERKALQSRMEMLAIKIEVLASKGGGRG